MFHVKRVYILMVLLPLLIYTARGGDTAESKPVQETETTASPVGPMEEAVSIRFVYPEFGVDSLEYEIDLDGQVLRMFSSLDYKSRDPEAENGGWTGIEPLTEEQISNIRSVCAPMLQWEDYYENLDVQDGWYWHITVTFRDGSSFQTGGHHAWPEDYMQVGQELRDATGVEVLWPSQEP